MRIKSRRFVTLIEMIIVITLIGIIMGALAWRFGGALDKGKAFKTKVSIERLEVLLNNAVAENPGLIDDIESQWKEVVQKSPFVKDPNTLIYDGWGQEFEVLVEEGEIRVKSKRYEEYERSSG